MTAVFDSKHFKDPEEAKQIYKRIVDRFHVVQREFNKPAFTVWVFDEEAAKSKLPSDFLEETKLDTVFITNSSYAINYAIGCMHSEELRHRVDKVLDDVVNKCENRPVNVVITQNWILGVYNILIKPVAPVSKL
jgi:hypothetical protein